jgi:hypothetical protein
MKSGRDISGPGILWVAQGEVWMSSSRVSTNGNREGLAAFLLILNEIPASFVIFRFAGTPERPGLDENDIRKTMLRF